MNLRHFLLSLLLTGCGASFAAGPNYRWTGNTLKEGRRTVGILNVSHSPQLSPQLKINDKGNGLYNLEVLFIAGENADSASFSLDFTQPVKPEWWMVPAVSYNGNNWGRGKEPKGARTEEGWYTYSHRTTPIPGITYSETNRDAVALWADAPVKESDNFSCSIIPETGCTTQRLIWPEEEMPVLYSARDAYSDGYRKEGRVEKGDTLKFSAWLSVTPVLGEHRARHKFLTEAWRTAQAPEPEIMTPAELWRNNLRYAEEWLYSAEGDFRGFTIGFRPNNARALERARGYEIGWCGQNASFANSMLTDHLAHGNPARRDLAIGVLDSWARLGRLPNGLFVTNYDRVLYQDSIPSGIVFDACNLGTAALNYLEAFDLAGKCGIERPEYRDLALGILDFAMSDQQESGCYGRGWHKDGTCYVREGTIGAFLVPPMLEACKQTGNRDYLESGRKAYEYYMEQLKNDGYTTAGALDTWCIDKESSISLLRGAMRLYDLTGEKKYIDDAVAVSDYLSTWLWHYDVAYDDPANDLNRYGYHTFGATSVSTQHRHLDPYAVFWVPEWLRLSELTGDGQWREKALAVWKNAAQLVSDGNLTVHGLHRPAGSQNEAYFQSRWCFSEGKEPEKRVNEWLVAWPGAFRMETIRRLKAMDADSLAF